MSQINTQAHPNLDQVHELARHWGKQSVLGAVYEGFCRAYGYDSFGAYRHLRRAQVRALLLDDVMPPVMKSFIH